MRTLLVLGMLVAGSVGAFAQNAGEGRARTDRDYSGMRVVCNPYENVCRPGWWTEAWYPDIGSRWSAPYGFEIRIIGSFFNWEAGPNYGEVVYVATYWRTWQDEPLLENAPLAMLPSWLGQGVWKETVDE